MLNIVLVHPQIPPNTGNVARLCAALQCRLHLVKPLGFLTDDKTLKRAGLDYWEHVDLTYHESIEDFFIKHPQGAFYYLTTKGTKPYTSVSYRENDFLLFGSETSGLPIELMKKNPERMITIPMVGAGVRSLNLSSAVAMVAGEALRQVNNTK